jgi:hypothetical protein
MSSTAGIAGQNALAWAKLKMEFLKLFQFGDKSGSTNDAEQSLDETTRSEMERTLGFDLRDVRMHMTKQAGELAQQLNAEAFTIGSDIFAAEGKLSPSTREGKGLLVHELTHVVQQSRPQPVDLPHVPVPQFAPSVQSSAANTTQAAAAMETEAIAAEQASSRTTEQAREQQAPTIDATELAEYVYRLMQRELLLEKDRARR